MLSVSEWCSQSVVGAHYECALAPNVPNDTKIEPNYLFQVYLVARAQLFVITPGKK